MGHHVCQFGTVHKTCRCPKEHKIVCPTPDGCVAKQKEYLTPLIISTPDTTKTKVLNAEVLNGRGVLLVPEGVQITDFKEDGHADARTADHG